MTYCTNCGSLTLVYALLDATEGTSIIESPIIGDTTAPIDPTNPDGNYLLWLWITLVTALLIITGAAVIIARRKQLNSAHK